MACGRTCYWTTTN